MEKCNVCDSECKIERKAGNPIDIMYIAGNEPHAHCTVYTVLLV